jgi:hypothetical protein
MTLYICEKIQNIRDKYEKLESPKFLKPYASVLEKNMAGEGAVDISTLKILSLYFLNFFILNPRAQVSHDGNVTVESFHGLSCPLSMSSLSKRVI